MSELKIGLIGGSGLGAALGAEQGERVEVETPFGKPSSAITMTSMSGTDVAILQRHGPGHTLNPTRVPYRANIYALKQLGVTHIVASGATGSLREDIEPKHLVVPDQIIDKTAHRPSTFYEKAAVHVEMSEPYCPVTRGWLLEAAAQLNHITVHSGGTYVCMEGPAFSTRAESHMHRQWGGDLIGMTGMPEAKLAREAEIAYAMVSLPTDYDCWRPRPEEATTDPTALLREIIGNLEAATANSIELIKTALRDVSVLYENESPAHNALALAIWSDKSQVDPEEVKRLDTLWGRYFV